MSCSRRGACETLGGDDGAAAVGRRAGGEVAAGGKRLKRHLKRHPVNGTTWFGPEAFDLWKAKKAFIPLL